MNCGNNLSVLSHPEKPQTFEVVQDFVFVCGRESGKTLIKVVDPITYEILAKFESSSGLLTPIPAPLIPQEQVL
jgi:hypothetical protein